MLIPVGFHQLASFDSAAVGLGKGISIVDRAHPPTVNTAGSGYKTGDMLTASGGTALTAFQKTILRVETVDTAGAILTVSVQVAGAYTSKPSNAVTFTGGAGSGAKFDLTWVDDVPPENAVSAELRADTQEARLRDDGTDPTAAVGIAIKATDSAPYTYKGPLKLAKVIGHDGTALLNVAFYGIRRYQ